MASESHRAFNFFVHIFCFWAYVAATNTNILKQGDIFNSSASLVSESEIYTLKFYNLSNNWYLSIWYYQDTLKPVWLANRDKPIKSRSAVLLIEAYGNLVITSVGGHPIRLYAAQSQSNVSAIMQDDGNFVLREASSGRILWQSFDSPTDTFLPGMKLGINHKTGKKLVLSSWFTSAIPTSGDFTLEWIPFERQLLIKRKGIKYWSSGVLDNNGFGNLLFGIAIYEFNYTIYSSNEEEYITYKAVPNLIPHTVKILNSSTLTLRFDGTLRRQSDDGLVSVKSQCNGLRDDSGCERWKSSVPLCRNHGEKIERRYGYYGRTAYHVKYNRSLSFSDCLMTCWNHCGCLGAEIHDFAIPECTLWYENLTEVEDANGKLGETKYYIIIPGPPSPFRMSSEGKHSKHWIGIVIGVAAAALIGTILCVSIFMRWRRHRLKAKETEKFLLELTTLDNSSDAMELNIDGGRGHNLKLYSFSSLMNATNCFSSENKLGEGGFGPVYKGLLSNGREIAIKRLSSRSTQGPIEFKNELVVIAQLQHTNLVQLLGFCVHGEEKLLVYEYMPNKSLDNYIFDQSGGQQLDWKQSFDIIEGISQGLLYLHKHSRVRIIHRDLKAGNILLDQDMRPKISDFGMARIFRAQSQANTNRIVGTYGYMSPEYAMRGIFSEKSDVFSFGVLALEIVSRRRNNCFVNSDEALSLVGYAWQLWTKNAALELLHPTLRNSCVEDQVLRCINVALLCVEDNPRDRPTMSVVVPMLTSEGVKLPTPKLPAFCFGRPMSGVRSNEGTVADNPSINYVTISDVDGR